MREAIGAACGLAAAFILGWGIGTEREHARRQHDQQPRWDLDAEVDENDLKRWEAEIQEGRGR